MWTTPESEGDRHTSIVNSYAGFLSSITSRQRGGVLLFPVGHLIASGDKVRVYLADGRRTPHIMEPWWSSESPRERRIAIFTGVTRLMKEPNELNHDNPNDLHNYMKA